MAYLGYARKSSEDNKERQAASLPDQIFVLEGIKKRENLQINDIYQESRSAHFPGRPIFNEMLKRIENGGANALIVWHENRLSRNPVDAGLVIYLMDRGYLLEVKTPTRTYKNTPSDKFMLQIELASSKKDSDDKAIVVKRGLEKKCRDGWRPGVAPQGYLNDKATESGFRRILVDSERLPFIRKIFELYRGGTQVDDIHRIAKDEWGYRTRQKKRSGGKPLSTSMIYKILGNPFYTGKFEYPEGSGQWHEGRHEPAIKDELFEDVQVMLGHKSQYKLKNHEWAYTSLIKCGFCGSSITAEEKWQCICAHCKLKFSLTKKNKEACPRCATRIDHMQNAKILHYIYYRCKRRKDVRCRQKGIRVDILEKQVDAELSSLEIPQSFVDWAIRQINIMNDDDRDIREKAIQSVSRTHSNARTSLDNLVKLKISPLNSDGSLLSDEKFREEKLKLEAEIKELEKQLNNVDQRMLEAADELNEKFSFAARSRQRYAKGDIKVKREILSRLGSHLILLDGMLHIESPLPFMAIKKMKKETPILQEMLAPKEQSLSTTKTDALYASAPSLLRGQESRLV